MLGGPSDRAPPLQVMLRRSEEWIVLSARTCPRPGVPLLESEVFEAAFSACQCPGGFYISEPCVKGERIRGCEPCTECGDGEEEVSPCQGSNDRVCRPKQEASAPKNEVARQEIKCGCPEGKFVVKVKRPLRSLRWPLPSPSGEILSLVHPGCLLLPATPHSSSRVVNDPPLRKQLGPCLDRCLL